MTNNKKRSNFLRRRSHSLIGLVIVFAVLIAGYLAVRATLLGDDTPVSEPPANLTLLPGEAAYGNSVLLYPRIDRKDLASVKVHNPANAAVGEQYVDWGIGFAYDSEAKNSYGYMLYYGDDYELDEMQLTYLAAAVGTLSFTSRIEDHCEDFSPYGLAFASEEEALSVLVEKTDGTQHKIYFGSKNPSGTGYYVRCADRVTDENGMTYERDAVYLLNTTVSQYCEDTLLAAPTRMLTTYMTYPIASTFDYFALSSADGRLNVSFILANTLNSVQDIFGGSSLYMALSPEGYYSSSAFETYITRFEQFMGEEVVEFATEKVSGVDEETGEAYEFYTFTEETFAKYGLDNSQYFLTYVASYGDDKTKVDSSVYFSDKRPDGYYYAYSLNYGTIVRVSPATVDLLQWNTLDFVDPYVLRMSIFNCAKLTVSGSLDGTRYTETFLPTVTDSRVETVQAENLGKTVSVTYYTELFREFYTTIMRGEVPLTDEEKQALMQNEPYLELTITTPKITVYVKDENGNDTSRVEKVLPGSTRILRFYRYTNNRAMMTVEMIDSDGKSSGEAGSFYVLLSRLEKLIRDTKNLCDGIPFSYHDKE